MARTPTFSYAQPCILLAACIVLSFHGTSEASDETGLIPGTLYPESPESSSAPRPTTARIYSSYAKETPNRPFYGGDTAGYDHTNLARPGWKDSPQNPLGDKIIKPLNNLATQQAAPRGRQSIRSRSFTDVYNDVSGRITILSSLKNRYTYLDDAFECGQSCECSSQPGTGSTFADCSGSDSTDLLSDFPLDLPNHVVSVDLSNNVMTQLSTAYLSQYTSLRYLKLSGNQISCVLCSDTVGLTFLDISDNLLADVEDAIFSCMPNLTTLVLGQNRVESVTDRTLAGLTNLTSLDLSYNYLKDLQAGAFLEQGSLQELYLTGNANLTFESNTTAAVFQPLESLEVLAIVGCNHTGKELADILKELPALRELTTNGVELPFSSTFPFLTKMHIWCDNDNNSWPGDSLQTFFVAFPGLRFVSIKACLLVDLPPNTFVGNSFLQHLQLDQVTYDVRVILKGLGGLENHTDFRHLEIINNRKEHILNPVIVLRGEDVQNLHRLSQLQTLNLDADDISQLELEFLKDLPGSLETLSVRGNLLLSSQSVLYETRSIPNLTALCEDAQGDISYISGSQSSPPWSFQSRDHENPFIQGADVSTDCHSLGSIFKTTLIPVEAEQESQNKFSVYSASRSFNAGLEIFEDTSEDSKLLRYLNLSSTLITNWGTEPISYMPKEVLVADMSSNWCETLSETFFQEDNALVELHVSWNYLGPLLGVDDNGTVFARLTKLEFLDLSHNHLFDLPYDVFQHLSNLMFLILDSNNINVIDLRLSHMKNLTYLSIGKNSILEISERTRSDLDAMAQDHLVNLDLTYNPLPCQCNGLELLRWLATTRVQLLKEDFLQCDDESYQRVDIEDLRQIVSVLHWRCVTQEIIILSCSFTGVVIVILLITVWAFKNRWRLIYMRNMAFSKFFGYRPMGSCTRAKDGDTPYTFDAFFVYEQSGQSFVLDECLPELETKRGHSLCVEDRDFLPGSFIPCNITSAVSCSHFTVVVLDAKTTGEGWTNYALEMAQVEAVYAKRDTLRLLVLKPPPAGRLHAVYYRLANGGCVDELPSDRSPEKMREFWDAFSRSLGHCNNKRRQSMQPQLNINGLSIVGLGTH